MFNGNHLAENLAKSGSANPSKTFAFLPDGSEVTYGDLFIGAQKYASTLFDLGVGPGDRVAVQVDKSIEVLKLYLGTILAGGVFLPLNTAYTAAEIGYFLNDATPKLFVCSPARQGGLSDVAQQASVPSVLTLDGEGQGSLRALVGKAADSFDAVPRGKDDLAAILYTSGTTGRSKGAMLTHDNLWSNSETLRQVWRFTEQDILIHALPIFHTHGLFVATNISLAAGSSVILMPGFDANAIMAAMPHATALMGVPTFYVRLLNHPDLSPARTENMRLFVSGSAPLLAETHDLWREKTGHAILERYGMTETNMNTSNPYDGDRRAGTVGHPLPGVDLIVTDPESGATLPQGDIGVLEVRGPNVFAGYWQMPEKTKEELRDNGFFITGDLGRIDEDGYVHIIGRSKDLIISGGFNVYPKELESLIDEIEGVLESAVIGLAHKDFGEAVTAVIVPTAPNSVSEDTIRTVLAEQVAKFKQPKQVFFVDELPRNTMGKVQKNVLRDRFNVG